MIRIGVAIHGPAVIDSGRAKGILEVLAGTGSVRAVLGGTMGRAAVIDAGLEGLIDINRNLKPGESIRALISCSDVVLLVNEGKTRENGIEFGRLVYLRLGSLEVPFFQIEYGGNSGKECLLIHWNADSCPFAINVLKLPGSRLIKPPPAKKNIEFEGDIIRKRVAGARPGEYVTFNGTVIGKALSDDVWIILNGGRIIALKGGRLKPHGVEKLEHADIFNAIIRSGPLRTSDVTPRVLKHVKSGYAVIIDHSAEDTFEVARDAEMAVVVGDDTTAVAGDLLSRLGIPMIGITDGDRDGITHHTHVPPGSVILKLAPGNDDIVGRRVKKHVFRCRARINIEDTGFDGILADVLQMSAGLVQEITRY